MQDFDTTSLHWDIARDLRQKPNRLLYPTDDFWDLLTHEGRSSFTYQKLEPLSRPITVKEFLDKEEKIYMRGGSYPRSLKSSNAEDMELERHIADLLIEGWITLDPREASMSIRDKYTGPKN